MQGLTPPAAGTFVGGVQWMRENSFWTRPLTAARVRPLLWIFSKSFTRSNGSSIISTWSSWWSSSSPDPHAKTIKNNTTPIQEQNRWSIFQNEHCTCWTTLGFFFFLKKEMSLNPRLRVLGIKWSTGYGDTETQPFCDVSPDGLNSYTVVSTVSRIHA